MKLNRRSFLTAVTLSSAGMTLGAEAGKPGPAPTPGKIKLGISTYSYWHFRPPKVSIETVIDKAAADGNSRLMDTGNFLEDPYPKLKQTFGA